MTVQSVWQPRAAVRKHGRHRCGLAAAAAGLAIAGLADTAVAKTPGKTYCFNGICHRVKTIAETQSMVGRTSKVSASFYDSCGRDRFNPCGLTSSGEVFRPDRPDNAASPIYPNGTKLLVWHPGTRKTLVVRVNNAGPYWGSRTLDLSRAAGDRLGIGRAGVASLQVKVLAAPTRSEATYQKHRTYASVPGYVGVFKSIETAFLEFGRVLSSVLAPPAQAAHAAAGRDLPGHTAKPRPVTQVAAVKPAARPAVKVAAAAPAPAKPAVRATTAKPAATVAAAAKPAASKAAVASSTAVRMIVAAARPSGGEAKAGPKPAKPGLTVVPGGGRLPRT